MMHLLHNQGGVAEMGNIVGCIIAKIEYIRGVGNHGRRKMKGEFIRTSFSTETVSAERPEGHLCH